MTDKDLELLAINTIRTLSIDAVQAAKSGHSGTPLALAPLVYTIWNRVMNFDPLDIRLGAVRRRRGPDHRHENVWGVCPAEGTAEEIWVRA
jgi:transketolase N-terminal domain/subunit